MSVVTRFAPSPTGMLHIGGARTAYFNWLFARHHGGTFLLRIEDTDKERSTEDAKRAIIDGLGWLGLTHDGDTVFQSKQEARHQEIAEQLLREGKAYKCYCSAEELAAMREEAQKEGKRISYDRRWRDRDASEAPAGVEPVIRIKAPLEGEIIVKDAVQGDVRFGADQLDDFIILRSDGSPTYMLAVVVDDHDMGITHIIRGDDHLNNAARQTVLFDALGWDVPQFAHIPLIHGPDGAKLSKRHGALGVEAYRDMGYLPEAVCNYLLRLGWAHGDDEIISRDQAIEWFSMEGINKAAARFDFAKLENLNGHYIRQADNARLIELVRPLLVKALGRTLNDTQNAVLTRGMEGLKQRAETLNALAESALFYVIDRPLQLEEKAAELVNERKAVLADIADAWAKLDTWDADSIKPVVAEIATAHELKLGKMMPAIRASVTGGTGGPDLMDILTTLGQEEAIARLRDVC